MSHVPDPATCAESRSIAFYFPTWHDCTCLWGTTWCLETCTFCSIKARTNIQLLKHFFFAVKIFLKDPFFYFFGVIMQVCSHSVYSQELLRCMLDIARVEFRNQIHLSVYDEPVSFFLLILTLCWCIFDRNNILFYHSWSLFHKFLILFYFRIYDTYRNIHSVWITSQHRHQIQKEGEITSTHL